MRILPVQVSRAPARRRWTTRVAILSGMSVGVLAPCLPGLIGDGAATDATASDMARAVPSAVRNPAAVDVAAVAPDSVPPASAFVGISADNRGRADGAGAARATLGRFVDVRHVDYPVFLDTDLDLMEAYGGFNDLPTTFLVDAEGRTVCTYKGAHTFAEFAGDIRPLLEGLGASDPAVDRAPAPPPPHHPTPSGADR